MKRRFTSAALTGAALIALVLAGCDSADLAGPDEPGVDGAFAATVDLSQFDADASDGTVDLIGGKNTKVGTVSWTDVPGGVEVTYLTLAGYCITEWHLDGGNVNGGITGIPMTRSGNPKNGQFEYGGEGACLTTVTQVIPDSQFGGAGDRIIAAHAVVVDNEEGCDFFYGIASDGNIYRISLGDLMTPGDETEVLFFDTDLEINGPGAPDDDAATINWPNSIAYNTLTDRLYYSNATALGQETGEGVEDPTAPLYFYDFASNTGDNFSGNLTRRSASGTFDGGTFYYVPQNIRDNLRAVTFNPDGTIATRELVCENFTGHGADTAMIFGDLVYNAVDGLVYGSALISGTSGATFFSVDPSLCDGLGGADDSGAYTVIGTDLNLSQLTYDCDGNLIGFDTGNQQYLLIDPTDGSQQVIGDSDIRINDLAPGQCDCPGEFDETAWGAGPSFPGNNWAMYINIDS